MWLLVCIDGRIRIDFALWWMRGACLPTMHSRSEVIQSITLFYDEARPLIP